MYFRTVLALQHVYVSVLLVSSYKLDILVISWLEWSYKTTQVNVTKTCLILAQLTWKVSRLTWKAFFRGTSLHYSGPRELTSWSWLHWMQQTRVRIWNEIQTLFGSTERSNNYVTDTSNCGVSEADDSFPTMAHLPKLNPCSPGLARMNYLTKTLSSQKASKLSREAP